jgi:hypothetical protein
MRRRHAIEAMPASVDLPVSLIPTSTLEASVLGGKVFSDLNVMPENHKLDEPHLLLHLFPNYANTGSKF